MNINPSQNLLTFGVLSPKQFKNFETNLKETPYKITVEPDAKGKKFIAGLSEVVKPDKFRSSWEVGNCPLVQNNKYLVVSDNTLKEAKEKLRTILEPNKPIYSGGKIVITVEKLNELI